MYTFTYNKKDRGVRIEKMKGGLYKIVEKTKDNMQIEICDVVGYRKKLVEIDSRF